MAHYTGEQTTSDQLDREAAIRSLERVTWFEQEPIVRDLNVVVLICSALGLEPIETQRGAFAVATRYSPDGRGSFYCHYDPYGRIVQTDSLDPIAPDPMRGTTTQYEFDGRDLAFAAQYDRETGAQKGAWNRHNWNRDNQPEQN